MEQFFGVYPWIVLIAILVIPIKGVALWKSARLSQKWWFTVLLVVNTLGILDLIYIFFVAKKYKVETKEENPAGM